MNIYSFTRSHRMEVLRVPRIITQLLIVLIISTLSLFLLLWGPLGGFKSVGAAGNILYVAQTTGSDSANACQNEATPCRTITHALSVATSGNEVRVAAGTYAGVNGDAAFKQSVHITKSVVLRGGYTTTNWLEADTTSNLTIIDAQDQGWGVYVDGSGGPISATIEGFTIVNGHSPSASQQNGGGFYVQSSQATIRNNVIHANEADNDGGAIYNNAGTIIVENNEIYDNAAEFGGGAIASNADAGTSVISIRNNEIYNNSVTSVGSGSGGAIFINNSTATIEANIIHHNDGAFGGAIFNATDGVIYAQNNIIYENSASNQAGAVYNFGGDFNSWHNTVVMNSAASQAGAILQSSGNLLISNSIIISNSTLIGTSGGVVVSGGNGNAHYSAIFNNSPNLDVGLSTANTRNIAPSFVAPALGDYHLNQSSGLIDVGDSTSHILDDVDGEGRPFSFSGPGGFDVGADEVYNNSTCFARVNDGVIFSDLQAAVDTASENDLIKVAGYCDVAVNKAGSIQVLYISQTVTIRGGYTTTNWSSPSDVTILDGTDSNRVVYITNTNTISPSIEGFRIRNGRVTDKDGAGILIAGNAAPIIQNNFIYNNQIINSGNGGGIANEGGDATIQFNTINDNAAPSAGSGIYNTADNPSIINNLVISNVGSAGIHSASGSPVVQYNDVFGHSASQFSGTLSDALIGVDGNISVAPQFVDAASDDFHLAITSPVLGQAGTVNNPPTFDIDGEARVQGQQADIGADEATTYPDIQLSPNYADNANPDTIIVYTHTLENAGSISDTFDLSISSTSPWDIQVDPQTSFSLAAGETVTFTVSISVPASATPDQMDTTVVTATSQANAAVFAVVSDETAVNVIPGALLTPAFSENMDPGTTVTLTHQLQNTGNYTDDYVISLNSSGTSWGTLAITAPYTVTIPQGGTVDIDVLVNVPKTAPVNLSNKFQIMAQRPEGLEPPFSVIVTDTIIANAISGDRFVSTTGNDNLNNCTDPEQPCASVSQGVETVSAGNTVWVAQGTYNESDIFINKTITLRGGYPADFAPQERNLNSSATVIDANASGRAIFVQGANPTIETFTIRNGDVSASGGGLYALNASPILQSIQFINNKAVDGGGLALNNGSLQLTNSVFSNNQADSNGGGISLLSGNATILNNTVIGNTAGSNGAGVYANNSVANITNTIIVSNTAGNRGGGIFRNASTLSLDYNNFFNNAAPIDPDGNISFGSHTIFDDPLLNSNFTLPPDSPAVDAGDPATDNNIDFKGDLRPVDQGFDIGADELAGCLALIINTGQKFGSIQNAVDASLGGYTIRVSGYCRGVTPIDIGGQTISQTVYLDKSIILSGGWDSEFEDQDSLSTLDAEGLGRTVVISDSVSPIIQNFNLINGNAAGLGGGPAGEDAGGGIYSHSGGPSFDAVVIRDSQADIGGGLFTRMGTPSFTNTTELLSFNQVLSNTATISGGGIYVEMGSLTFRDTHVSQNSAQYGAGIYNEAGQPRFTTNDNQIYLNDASENGGGFYNEAGNPSLERTRIYSNTATNHGGGIYNSSTVPFNIRNMLIYNNVTIDGSGHGGGIYNAAGSPLLWHNTLHNNQAGGDGGGIYNNDGSPTIGNTILFENSATNGGGIFVVSGSPQLSTNDVYSNTASVSGADYAGIAADPASLSLNPQFSDAANGNYHLTLDSPIVDQGDPTSPVDSDFDGNIRPSNQGFDIGADEIAGCVAIINNDVDTRYGSVQQAVDATTAPSDVVKVSGTCRGVHQITVSGLGVVTQTVHLTKTVKLQGGWNDAFSEFDPQSYTTTLHAGNKGHVIFIGDEANPTIEYLDITGGSGGAIFNTSALSPTLRTSNIFSNSATDGGAIYNLDGNIIVRDGNRFFDNNASNGSVLYSTGGTPRLTNNFIYNNSATLNGTLYVDDGTPIIWHNTIVGNSAADGSGLYRNGGSPDVRNNIIIDGTGSALQSADGGPGTGVVGYNNLANNSSLGNVAGANNVLSAPVFSDTVSHDYRLKRQSEAVDAGDPSLMGLLTIDYTSEIRPSHQGMDMGADEIPGCYTRIDEELPIYGSIQYAIDQADGPDPIIDVAGTCYGVNNHGGTQQAIYISKTITLRGGWTFDPTTENNFSTLNRTGVTTINVEAAGRGLYLTGSDNGSEVERFKFMDGQADQGGAVYNDNTSALLKNNVFYNNNSTGNGGAIYSNDGDLQLWHNTVVANAATGNGGGVYIAAGNPTIRNNILAGNSASLGEAVFGAGGSPDLDYNAAWPDTGNQYSGIISGTNSLIASPNFANADPNSVNFVTLSSTSAMIDAGDPDSPIAGDFKGNPRPGNQGFDIGAHEYTNCLAKVDGVIYGHIQLAVDAALDGFTDVIQVAGNCQIRAGDAQVVLVKENTTFVGGWDLAFESQDDETLTTLDALELGRVVEVPAGVAANFSNFRFNNGLATDGGAVYNEGSLSLTMVDINASTATNHGGGIYNANILSSLDEVSFNTITATNGGGIYNAATITTLSQLDFIDAGAALDGGGIYNESGATISSFINPDSDANPFTMVTAIAGRNGGGLYNEGEIGTITQIDIISSEAGNDGAGIYNTGSIEEIVASGVFLSDAGNIGGGIYSTSPLEIRNSFFSNNTSVDGAGIYSSAPVTLTNVYLFDNAATGNGGGLHLDHAGLSQIYHNTIRQNHADSGGGIYQANGSAIISNTLLVDNSADSGASAIEKGGSGSVTTHYTNFFQNSAPETNGTVSNNNSYNLDPEFLNASSVALKPTSPVIDIGDPNTHIKFDCCSHAETGSISIRPQNNGYDLGAWEEKIDYGVLLEPDHNTSANPDSTVVLTHILTNTGEITDSYDLTLDSSSQGWATLMVTSPITLAGGAQTTVAVSITVPPGAAAGLQEINTIRAASKTISDTFDTATNIVTVKSAVDLEIGPDNQGYGAPTDILTYTHTVTNTGNISDTVRFFLVPQYGVMETSLVTATLEPLETVQLTVTVTLPDWVAGGIDDVANVVAKSSRDPNVEKAAANTTHISYTTGIRHVSPIGDDAVIDLEINDNNCTNPLYSPCRTIAHALSQAMPGDLIKIAGGLYTKPVTRTIGIGPGAQVITQVVYLDKEVTLQGGYTLNWDQAFPVTNSTILQAPENGRGIYVTNVLSATIDGLEIVDGDVTGLSNPNGGGIFNDGADLTLNANNFHDNAADVGGAIYSTGVITIQNNVFHSNEQDQGAVYIDSGQAAVQNNTFYSNTSTDEGGAIYHNAGSLTVNNNIFQENSAGDTASTILVDGGSTAIDTNLFYNNTYTVTGAASLNEFSFDPLLVDPANGDFHIPKGSPAEEQGLTITTITSDYEHHRRPQGGLYDLGADEREHEPGLSFAPNQAITTSNLSQVLLYTHTLTNTGESTDTYTLDYSSSQGWVTNITPTPTVTLAPLEEAVISMTVTVGGPGSGGLVEYSVITATSGQRASVKDTVVNTTTVSQAFGVELTPNYSTTIVPDATLVTYTHTISNNGNGTDSFTFTATSSQGWPITLPPPITVTSAASETVVLTLTVPAESGGTVDTTTITATSMVSATIQDSATNTTTVPLSRSVLIEPNHIDSVQPGEVLTFSHTLTNTGNKTDSFTLTVSSSQNWNVVLDPITATNLGARTSIPVTAVVTVPLTGSGSLSGTVDIGTITATSVNSPTTAFKTAVNTSTVGLAVGVELTPDHDDIGGPGSTVVYSHTIANTGNSTDSFTITAQSSQGWSLSHSSTITLAPSQTDTITLSLTIPITAGGQIDHATITATSNVDDSVTGTAINTTTVVQTYGVVLAPDYTDSPAPDASILTYTHTITNLGNGIDSFTFTGDSSQGWSVKPPPSVTVGAGLSADVVFTLTIPAASGGLVDVMAITATSVASPTVQDSAVNTTTIPISHSVLIALDQSNSGQPGAVVTYSHLVTNTGNTTDSFTLQSLSNRGWDTTVQPATLSDLASGSNSPVTVTVTVPSSGPDSIIGVVDVTTVTVTSVNSPTIAQATAANTTTVSPVPGVLLTPDHDITASSDTTVVFSHTITNTGNATDTFTFAATSSQGWLDSHTPVITLTTGQTETITLTLTVPAATGAQIDTTIITATSQLDADVSATAANTTTVLQTYGVDLTPDHDSWAADGASIITYTHTLSNTGNGSDTFSFAASSSQGWTVLVPPNVMLTAGTDTAIVLTITIPSGSGGLIDVTTITATSVASPTVQASAVNTTTIPITRSLQLAPDRSGSGQPGTIVTYAHTLTNTGNSLDTFALTVTSMRGWVTDVQPTSINSLLVGQSRSVTVTITIPTSGPDAAVGVTDTAVLTATSTLSPTAAQATVVNTTTVAPSPGVIIGPDNSGNADTNTLITYSHIVTNSGNLTDTFSFSATSSQGWSVTTAGPLQLGPDITGTVTLSLTVPANVGGTVDVTTITATSNLDSDIFDSAIDTTTITHTFTVSLTPASPMPPIIPPNATQVIHTYTITNEGNGSDSFSFGAANSLNWPVTLPPNVALNPGQSTTVMLTITVPAGSGGLANTAVLTATSTGGPASQDSAIDFNIPLERALTFQSNESGTGKAGDVLIKSHQLTNTGNSTDTFDISIASTYPWTIAPNLSSVTLAAGQSTTIQVTINIPADAPDLTTSLITVTAASTFSPTLTQQAVVDTITVAPADGYKIYLPGIMTNWPPPTYIDLVVTNVSIDPASPAGGESATIFVTIKNQGNLPVGSNNNFFLDLYVDPAGTPQPLEPGDIVWGVQGADLNAGQSKTFSTPFIFTSGAHQLYIQVDTDNTIAEALESNNIFGPQPINATGATSVQERQPESPPAQLAEPRPTPTP